jgi:hypothetical protein
LISNPFPGRSGESLSLKRSAGDCYDIPEIRESLITSHCIEVQTGDRLQRSLKVSDLGVGDMRLEHPRQAAHALSLSDYNLTTFEVMCDGRQAKLAIPLELGSGKPRFGTHTSRVWRLSSITRVPWRKVIGVPGQR